MISLNFPHSHLIPVTDFLDLSFLCKMYISAAITPVNPFFVVCGLRMCRVIYLELFRVPIKSRLENPQKLTQLSPRSHPRHPMGKRTTQRDTIKDITTSDSQVNNYFLNRWSPASLTLNIYFYLYLYLYITRITNNKNKHHI